LIDVVATVHGTPTICFEAGFTQTGHGTSKINIILVTILVTMVLVKFGQMGGMSSQNLTPNQMKANFGRSGQILAWRPFGHTW